MNAKQWQECMTIAPPLTKDTGYWKVQSWNMARNGGTNYVLALDFMVRHPEEYHEYESEGAWVN